MIFTARKPATPNHISFRFLLVSFEDRILATTVSSSPTMSDPTELASIVKKFQPTEKPKHPLEDVDFTAARFESDLAMLQRTHGIHMPLKLQMEAYCTQQTKRIPGLPSSNLHFDVLMGRDTDIDFEDVFEHSHESKEVTISAQKQAERDMDEFVARKA